ncbi:hypothetical protein AMD27_10945 [Acinetobacter sp. TGL-Y2]|nr:hypothetical protein AMD27_10945 [Acinetobacter sp. TGL-Y2]
MSVTSHAIQWGAESTGDKLVFNYIRSTGYHLASTIDGGSVAWAYFSEEDEKSIDMSRSMFNIFFKTKEGWKLTNTCPLATSGNSGSCKLWTSTADKLTMQKAGYMNLEIRLVMKNADKDKVHVRLIQRPASGFDNRTMADDDLYIRGANCLAQTNQVWNVGHFTAGAQEKKSFNFNIEGMGNSEGYLELESNDLSGSTMTLGGGKKGPILKFEQSTNDDQVSPDKCTVPASNNMCVILPKKGGQIIVAGEADASLSEPGSFSSTLKATLTCD